MSVMKRSGCFRSARGIKAVTEALFKRIDAIAHERESWAGELHFALESERFPSWLAKSRAVTRLEMGFLDARARLVSAYAEKGYIDGPMFFPNREKNPKGPHIVNT